METPNTTKQTIAGVIAEKIALYIREHKATQILSKVVELIAGIFLGVTFAVPALVLSAFEWMVTTHGFMIPKVAGIMLLFFTRKSIAKNLHRFRKFAEKRRASGEKEKLVDGIPVSELADYLMRNANFKREGVNGVRETFGLNMEKFNRLAGNLEHRRILKRGENNMRVLDGRWSRQALIDFLGDSEDSGKSENWLRVFKINNSESKVRLDKNEIMAATAQ